MKEFILSALGCLLLALFVYVTNAGFGNLDSGYTKISIAGLLLLSVFSIVVSLVLALVQNRNNG